MLSHHESFVDLVRCDTGVVDDGPPLYMIDGVVAVPKAQGIVIRIGIEEIPAESPQALEEGRHASPKSMSKTSSKVLLQSAKSTFAYATTQITLIPNLCG